MRSIEYQNRSSIRSTVCQSLVISILSLVGVHPSVVAQPQKSGATQAQAGWRAYEAGRFEEAKELMQRAVKISPSVADYHAALAQIDRSLGDQESAIQQFKIAIQLKPADPEFRLNLAQLLQTQNKDQEALRILQGAHPSLQLSGTWHFSRGFSLFRVGRFTDATSEFKAVVGDPRFQASASFFLGNIAYLQGRFDEAEPYLATAVQLGNAETNKAYNAYTYDYGLVLYKQGKFAAAEQQFQASIARYPSDPLPWMFLGRCEAELGNYPKAIEMLETSIKTDATFQLSYYELARLQQRHGDPKRAAELFEKIGQMKKAEIDVEEARAMKLKTGMTH